METHLLVSIAIVIVCFAVSAFFSGSETAMTASSRARMFSLAKGGEPRATTVDRLLSNKERLIGGILVGNNVVNTAAAALTTGVLITLFGEAGILYATIIVSVLVIIFCEILPKTIAINQPDRTALIVARPLAVAITALGPIIIVIEALVRRLLAAIGLGDIRTRDVLSAVDELKGQVGLLHKEGEVETAERDMLEGLLDLTELTVEDVMVHRTEMRMIDADLPPYEIVAAALDLPFTRIPLWRGSVENIVGVLHAKDLLKALHAAGGNSEKISIEGMISDPWFVPDVTAAKTQLKAFLAKKAHFALVIDEYGEVQGLVTLEDLIEEIVGDIRDEHDEAAAQGLRRQPDGSLVVDGQMAIRELNRAADWNLPDENAATVAGLLMHESQVIPREGQSFVFFGLRFEVVRKQRHRITRVKITPIQTDLPESRQDQDRS